MTEVTAWAGEHHLLILLVIGTLLSAVWLASIQKRLVIKWWTAGLLAAAHTLTGVFSVKAFAFMEAGFDTSSLGSMSLYGAVFFMPLTYLVGAKLVKCASGDVCDVFTPAMIVTLMCARINCIISGCCAGLPIPGTSLQWPTRELEIVFYIAALVWLGRKITKNMTHGTAYPLYMAAYGGFRFIIEWFRRSDFSGLHPAHIWSIISLALGLSIYFELMSKKSEFGKERRK